MINQLVTLKSQNQKTGPIPTISRPQVTCPNDCPLMGAGCYGENNTFGGAPSMFTRAERAVQKFSIRDIALRAKPGTPAVRVNVVGDYLNEKGKPDLEYIADTNFIAKARDWVMIAYTHAWKRMKPDMFDYVVRASCQSEAELKEAHAAGWWTVVVDPGPEHPDTLIGKTIDGRKVVQCPATNGKAANCAECRLCGREAAIVAFPTHGTQKKKAAQAVDSIRRMDA